MERQEQVTPRFSCLVTRPKHQSDPINRLLSIAGFATINFPTIEITGSPDSEPLTRLAQNLDHIDIALFVSRNAVDFTFKQINPKNLPDSLQLGVIGKGSMLALQAQGVESQIIPAESYNSEGLLASATLQQVANKNIVILRGQQGRNLLGDTLKARGAKVEYVEVYRRVLPEYSEQHFDNLTQNHFPDLAIFTSAEGLQNAFKLVTPAQAARLQTIPWLLISERMRETAQNLGHNADIIIASSASDAGILQALTQWHNTHKLQ